MDGPEALDDDSHEFAGIVEIVAPNGFVGWSFLESRETPQIAIRLRGQQVHAGGRVIRRPDVAEAHGSGRNPVGFLCVFEPDDLTAGDERELEFFIDGQPVAPLVRATEALVPPWLNDVWRSIPPPSSLIDILWLLATGEPFDRVPEALRVALVRAASAVDDGSFDPSWFVTGPRAAVRERMHARSLALQIVREYGEGGAGPAARAFEAQAWRVLGMRDAEYIASQRGPVPSGDDSSASVGVDESPNPLMPVNYWREVVGARSLNAQFVHPVLMALWSPCLWSVGLHPALGDMALPARSDTQAAAPLMGWFADVSASRCRGGAVEGDAITTLVGSTLWSRDVEKRDRHRRLTAPRRRVLEAAAAAESVTQVADLLSAIPGDAAAPPLPAEDAPAVSIILPTIRHGHGLAAAISSVLAQTDSNWELVIIDDSTEAELDLAEVMPAASDRVSVVRTGGQGAAAARNAGARAARADWLMWLDDDDVLLPCAVAVVRRRAAESGARWMYGKAVFWDGVVWQEIGEPFDVPRLRSDNYVTQVALAIQRALLDELGGYDESLPRTIDYDIVLRLANAAEPEYIDEILCVQDVQQTRRRISTTQSPRWANHVIHRSDSRWSHRATPDDAVISVVIPVYTDWRRAADAVRRLREDLPSAEVEIVVVDDGLPPQDYASLGVACDQSEATLVSTWVNQGFAAACNEGFLQTTGSRVVFLNDDVRISGDALLRLVRALDDPAVAGVQPVTLMDEGRRYETAGVVIPEVGLPYPFLRGLSVDPLLAEDLRGSAFQAVNAAVLAVRSADFRAVNGFDPLFRNGMEDLDLCLRLTQAAVGRGESPPIFKVEADAACLHDGLGSGVARTSNIPENRRLFSERWAGRLRVDDVDMWDRLGFLIDGYDVKPGESTVEVMPQPRVRRRDRLASTAESMARLDVVIATPASRLAIESWGDTYFGMALVKSLRRLGLASDLYPFDADDRNDDATQLHLVGLFGTADVVTEGNVAWVISHPSRQSTELLSGYAGLIIASDFWTPPCGEVLGRMLQPTDAGLYGLDRGDAPDVSGRCLFIGNRRNADRPVVRWAVEAGVPVTLIGAGWDDFADYPNVVLSRPVPRRQVFGLYREARLVLNDHWPDMLANGFISNRLADLRAVGARVATDVPRGMTMNEADGMFAVHRSADLKRAWSWSADRTEPSVDTATWDFDAAALQAVSLMREAGLLA